MRTTIKVTNDFLFDTQVKSVDTSGLKCSRRPFECTGHLEIYLENGETFEADGQHGAMDYEEDYGFILIADTDSE